MVRISALAQHSTLSHTAYSILSLALSISSSLLITAQSIEAAFAADRASKLAAAFDSFDANSDGVVTYAEFTSGLEKSLGDGLDDKIVRRLFGELDSDGNEVIDAEEFKLSVADMQVRMESYMREEKQNQIEAAREAREAKEKVRVALRIENEGASSSHMS